MKLEFSSCKSSEREKIDFILAVIHRSDMDTKNKVQSFERFSLLEPHRIKPEPKETMEMAVIRFKKEYLDRI